VTPFPSFPQVGEGELRVYMRQETINTKVQARLASHKGMISLREWWLSSPECSLRGVSKPQSVLRPSGGAFKGEL
jgi:hypothetical protein